MEDRADAGRPPRLLVVSYLFPPDPAVGALRWAGITKFLTRNGWDIDVLAGGDVSRPARMESVRVHTVARARTLNDAYRSHAARTSSGDSNLASGAATGGPDVPRTGALRTLQRAVAASMRYPDYSRGWVLRAARAARRVIRREGIDVVVSSGPPHTGHVVALLATAGSAARWVMDLRDPWGEVVRPDEPAFLRRTTRLLERAALGRADAVICNTSQYARELRDRGRDAVHWVPNGIDLEGLPAPVPFESPTLTLSYVGTLYFNRDLGPILDAMQAYRSAHPQADVRLRFAGHADAVHSATFDRQVRDSLLSDEHVERLGHVARSEAQRVLQQCHLTVVLAQQQPMQVPAKLYEAMGLGVPTLVLAEPGTAAATEAQRIGAFWREPTDIAGIRAVFEEVMQAPTKAFAEMGEPFDYRSIAREVETILRAVAS